MNRAEITTVLETLQLDLERMEAADVKASAVLTHDFSPNLLI